MKKPGLNHVYRLIWNRQLGTWTVAAETTKSKGKSTGRVLIGALLLGSLALSPAAHAIIYTVDDGDIVQDFVVTGADEQHVLGGSVSGTEVQQFGRQEVFGGQVNDTNMGHNTEQIIHGGTVNNTSILHGRQTVQDGVVTGTTLNSEHAFLGDAIQEVNGGLVKDTTINSSQGSHNKQIITGGIVENTLVRGGAIGSAITAEQIVSGGSVSGTRLQGMGAAQTVNNGTVTGTTIENSGRQNVFGGVVTDTHIESGGEQVVDGGRVVNVTATGGWQHVKSGIVEGILEFRSATQAVLGSVINNARFLDGASQIVAGGTVHNSYFENGSDQHVSSGVVTDTVIVDGTQTVSGGDVSGTRIFGQQSRQEILNGMVADTVLDGGASQWVEGGTVMDTIVNDNGIHLIIDGHVVNTTLNTGAYQEFAGGTSVNTTIHSGATLFALDHSWYGLQGIASQVNQLAGAALIASTDTTVSGNNSFGSFSIDAATASADNVVLENGGYFGVYAGGTANSTKVLDGGQLWVEDGGVLTGNTLIQGTGILGGNDLHFGTPGATHIVNHGVLEFDPSSNLALTTEFSGAGSILKSGSSALLLAGNTRQDNGLMLTGGELHLAAGTSHDADTGPALSLVGADAMQAVVAGAQLSSKSDLIVANGVGNAALRISDTSLAAANGKNLFKAMNNSQLDLDISNADLTGDVTYESGSQGRLNLTASQLTGRMQGGSLDLDASSRWDMTANSTVQNLANAGLINFQPGGSFKTLTVDGDLSGNGFFEMNTDLSAPQGDLLQVRGQTTGSHTLLVRDSGLEPSAANPLMLVDGNGGAGSFSLHGGHVDAGAFRYTLRQRGDDWHLASGAFEPPVNPVKPVDPVNPVDPVDPVGPAAPTKPNTPINPKPGDLSAGANGAVASHSAAANLANAQMNSLVKRLGELRMGKDEGGLWTRAVGRTLEIDENSSRAYQQDIKGTEIGADTAIDQASGKMYVGGMIGMYKSDTNFGEGANGEMDSKMLGAYATYIDDSGFYVDSVAKYSRIDNTIETPINLGGKAKGSYKTNGLGVGVEVGKRIDLDEGWFVEPQLELTATKTDGARYTMDNGLKVKADDTLSLQSRMGVLLGRSMTLENGMSAQPYVKASYITEHGDDAQVEVNGHKLKSQLPGDRVEIGVGGVLQLSERSKISLDIEYAKGDGIEQPLGVTLGYRYLW